MIFEGKGGKFSAGFDINVFEKVHQTGTLFFFFLTYPVVQLSYIENVDFWVLFLREFIAVFICAGDASVMPDVSISLVVNTIEGIIIIIKIPPNPYYLSFFLNLTLGFFNLVSSQPQIAKSL